MPGKKLFKIKIINTLKYIFCQNENIIVQERLSKVKKI